MIESSDFMTQLTYRKCERGDTGTYSIRLENDLGSDSIDIRFRVVDRPSPPQAPFVADDICPDSCRLSWKEPTDNGGSEITNYIVERLHVHGGNDLWEKAASFVRGTNCLIGGLVENEKYRFRVFAENQVNTGTRRQTSNNSFSMGFRTLSICLSPSLPNTNSMFRRSQIPPMLAKSTEAGLSLNGNPQARFQ